MRILILPDVNDIMDVLVNHRDVNTRFVFNIMTCQELADKKYDVGYFYIKNKNIQMYNSVYPLCHKIVSILQPNLRKYLLSVDFVIIPKDKNFFIKIQKV
jgi:hypothetical protein